MLLQERTKRAHVMPWGNVSSLCHTLLLVIDHWHCHHSDDESLVASVLQVTGVTLVAVTDIAAELALWLLHSRPRKFHICARAELLLSGRHWACVTAGVVTECFLTTVHL